MPKGTVKRVAALFCVLMLCFLAAGVGIFLYAAREGTVSRANFLRVRTGMTKPEVEKLFGESGEPVWITRVSHPRPYIIEFEYFRQRDRPSQPGNLWRKKGHRYVILFDGEGKAQETFEEITSDMSPFERLFDPRYPLWK